MKWGIRGLLIVLILLALFPANGQEISFQDDFSDELIDENNWTVEHDTFECLSPTENNGRLTLLVHFNNCSEKFHRIFLDRNVGNHVNYISAKVEYIIPNMGFLGLIGLDDLGSQIFDAKIFDAWAGAGPEYFIRVTNRVGDRVLIRTTPSSIDSQGNPTIQYNYVNDEKIMYIGFIGSLNLNFRFIDVDKIHTIRLYMGIYSSYYDAETLLAFDHYNEGICDESNGCYDAKSASGYYNYTAYGGSNYVDLTKTSDLTETSDLNDLSEISLLSFPRGAIFMTLASFLVVREFKNHRDRRLQ